MGDIKMVVAQEMTPPRKSAAKPSATDGPLKQWAMLVFGSVGVGATAVVLTLAVVLLVVGLYVQFVWPLTDWDLVSVSLETYRSTVTLALSLIFVVGFLAGFWFISGAAWKTMPRQANVPLKATGRSRR